MSINLEVLKELKKLEEDLAVLDGSNFQGHNIKHVINGGNVGDNLFPAGMTKEQYNAACDLLSREEVTYIGGDPNKPQGYISQSGRKVKFKRISGNMWEIVVYVGDEVNGTAITYYNRPYQSIVKSSNPYFESTAREYRYMCDFDNTHHGLETYTPPEYLSPEEVQQIKKRILSLKYF